MNHYAFLFPQSECQNTTGRECRCMQGFKWSDEVCQKDKKCCNKEKCTFKKDSTDICVSNNAVSVKGSLTLRGKEYEGCLKEDEEYRKCNNKLLRQMKTVYSTLTGFDTLTIKKYSAGSIIADFEMTMAYKLSSGDFEEKTLLLARNVSGSLHLETSGVVNLTMPTPTPVCNSHQPYFICTTLEDLKTDPVWELERNKEVFKIFSGTEATLETETMRTTIKLSNVSALWEGNYTCAYNQKINTSTISHKASAPLDISLLPNIEITTVPAFPHCPDSVSYLNVRINCEIEKNGEDYTVTWNGKNFLSGLTPNAEPAENGPRLVFSADAIVSCDKKVKPYATCTFSNRCNETRRASTDVLIIFENDPFCPADYDWKNTKAGETAVLKCRNEAGRRTRECKLSGTQAKWEPEISECVNKKVNNVLESANIVDIGLGSLDENAANVFSLLENVTESSETINTFPNMNTSVQVLSSLSQRIKSINNDTAVNDFLESSSNLLESSLSKSWTTRNNASNISLAQRYLTSVERLVQMTNIKGLAKKKNLEVTSSNCTSSTCKNKVFDVTVGLSGLDPGNIKTAAFHGLEKYLPNNDVDFEPNSIVVTTVANNTEGTKRSSDSVEVTINFKLNQPRRRHHNMKCVSWDNAAGGWTPDNCKWGGAFKQDQCICKKLSSFAILMSRYPEDIDGIVEVSYVGLCLSVLSLVASIVIELIVWTTVVKTNSLYLRHTAHINISLCLLIADCFFLASSNPGDMTITWCKTSAVLKHYCYLSMFFWMLCLSSILLHQTCFQFHQVGKKAYLRLSLLIGYVCPLLIVVVTFLCNNSGAEGMYYSKDTCWLVYVGLMEGSIHTFVLPVGIIVIFNIFSMVVVIMKLLDHPKNPGLSDDKEKQAAKTVLRSVILLTPIFGVTWIFGFALMLLDLTMGTLAIVVNYAFTVLNAFQGLFILLATCLGEKTTREALKKRLRKNAPASSTDSTVKLDNWKK
ncbi:adhesion G protein-coupled receptor F4 [Centropristis striata]|uniref:adhesion G protein-coupled receptor F4 n=1 Tax=Centropristis striata TaxID=184440 RepID=UPI0027DF3137|nr:adhesion G protein-coupled receptor F4 [Centropristis striata]